MTTIVDFSSQNNSIFKKYLKRIIGKETISENFVIGRVIPTAYSRKDDIFSDLTEDQLESIRSQNKYVVIDSRFEGWSTVYHGPYIGSFYSSCVKYNICPTQVVYVTSNLIETQIFHKYSLQYNLPELRVFCQPFALLESKSLLAKKTSIDAYKRAKWVSKIYHTDKIVLSLSNLSRQYRTYATFMLATSEISDHCLISHNERVMDEFDTQIRGYPKLWRKWCKNQPTIIDNSTEYNPRLHQKTIFNIVNETFVEDWYETSREFSEKTFHPMVACQPFVIYGQKGANQYIKTLGFKTYEDWFDLDFDDIDDPIDRYCALLDSVVLTTKRLKTQTHKQRMKWKFKNKEVLQGNIQNILDKSLQIEQDTKLFFVNLIHNRPK